MSDIGDARMPCEHGEFNKHNYTTHYGGGVTTGGFCDGGRPLTVDDLDVLRAAYMTGQYTSGIEEYVTRYTRGILAAALRLGDDL